MMNTQSGEINPEQKPHIPREIWVMVTAAFIIALGYGLIAPLLPQFVVSFDVSMAAAGLVVSSSPPPASFSRRCLAPWWIASAHAVFTSSGS